MWIDKIKNDLKRLADPQKALFFPRFFKDPKDIFLGVSVPNCRILAFKYQDINYNVITRLLKSNIHEERLVALMILVYRFKKSPEKVYKFYLANIKFIDNWDLVDLSSYKIVGEYLVDKPRDVLYKLVFSANIWERRIAIVSTMAFIRKGQFEDTQKIAEILLKDKEDLIQKALGWLLRELGKKDETLLIKFLQSHYHSLARTTLRCAIERFQENQRKCYLAGNFK